MEQILRSECLHNGAQVDFVDQSNRYFGDYHRVKIEIRCRLTIRPELFGTAEDPRAEADRVRRLLGAEVLWCRQLERMGVAGADLDRVRHEMIESFVKSSFSYLQHSHFPARLISRELAQRSSKIRSFRLSS
ncbi:MAG: hypothetical protein P8X63_01600 [Desulfuromonadaceae bacterium]